MLTIIKTTINLFTKHYFSELMRRVISGDIVVLTEHGKPKVVVIPYHYYQLIMDDIKSRSLYNIDIRHDDYA